MIELKPCPFCGGDEVDFQRYESRRWTVGCHATDCICEGPHRATMREAAEAWNTRADLAVTREEADAMVAAARLEGMQEAAQATTGIVSQAVKEAVAEERAKWSKSVTLIERCYFMEGKDAKWRAAHMNGIARDAQNSDGEAPSWAVRLFPRDHYAQIEDGIDAAIRQEEE